MKSFFVFVLVVAVCSAAEWTRKQRQRAVAQYPHPDATSAPGAWKGRNQCPHTDFLTKHECPGCTTPQLAWNKSLFRREFEEFTWAERGDRPTNVPPISNTVLVGEANGYTMYEGKRADNGQMAVLCRNNRPVKFYNCAFRQTPKGRPANTAEDFCKTDNKDYYLDHLAETGHLIYRHPEEYVERAPAPPKRKPSIDSDGFEKVTKGRHRGL